MNRNIKDKSASQYNDLKLYTKKLEEKIKSLEEIIAIVPGNLYWKDRNGILLGCNDEQAISAGLSSRDKIVGLKPIDLISEDQPENLRIEHASAIEKVDQQVMDKDDAITIEEKAVLPDGSTGTFLSKKTPLHDSKGKVKGLVGITLDITYLKRLEEKLNKISKSKSHFIIDISNLIRGPLTSILGAAQVLERSKMTDKQKLCIDLVINGAEQIIPLVNRLYDYVSLQDDTLKQTTGIFNVHRYFSDIANTYRELALSKSLQFNFNIEKNIPEWLEGGSYFLSQTLDNILTNAIRYTASGSIAFSVEYSPADITGPLRLKITISDSGQGIKKDQQKYLFSLFDQEEMNSDIDFTQAGLDLSISAKMMQQLGGDIKLKSELGKGSTFIIDMPVKRANISEKPVYNTYESYFPIEEPTKLKMPRNTKFNILILEDDPLAQKVLSLMLKDEYNCNIYQFYNLHDVYSFDLNTVDIIFTDMNLPDGTGIDFIKYYTKKHAERVPIIAITTHSSDEEKEKMSLAGATDILTKPVSFKALISIIDYYIFQEHLED